MPWMPSLARVMPVISLFIPVVSLWFSECALLVKRFRFSETRLIGLVPRHAFLGVAVAVILEHLLHDLGFEFAVGALGDLGQVKILNRISVDIEFEVAAKRGEIGLLQRSRNRLLVRKIALCRLHRAVDQQGRIVALHGVSTGHDVISRLIGGDEFLALGVVEIGRPVSAAEHADRRILLRGSVDSSTVKADSTGIWSARPACRYCFTRLTPWPPGMKVKTASGLSEAILEISTWKSSTPSGT